MSRAFDADAAENLEDIEKQFAVKAVLQARKFTWSDQARSRASERAVTNNFAETYWNLLEKISGSSLRLTKIDEEIYEHLLREFPEFESIEYGAKLNEDEMKSVTGKPRWRKFMNTYENVVDDFNFGTLLRTDVTGEYSEENTIFVPRMQFYAVEIFRNKKGLNDWVKEVNK